MVINFWHKGDIMKYRKRTVVIEAIKLGWDTWNEVCDFVTVKGFKGCYIDKNGVPYDSETWSDTMGAKIPTLDGVMIAKEGDFIIKGINGKFYPCKPDIFAKTYEPVECQAFWQQSGDTDA